MKNELVGNKITNKVALSLLNTFENKGKERVHTLETGFFMMGCDMDLSDVKKKFKGNHLYLIEAGAPMGHNVVIIDKNKKALFLDVDKEKLTTYLKEKVAVVK
jgi:hypothetical protein